MPRFGQIWFNADYFGGHKLAPSNFKSSIRRIPLGFLVRRQFARKIIFRVRRGNGYYGSTLGELYQDKFKYFVPSSINNAEGATARSALTTAVSNWQSVLSDAEKKEYNRRAGIKRHLSGYNLYVGEYVAAHA